MSAATAMESYKETFESTSQSLSLLSGMAEKRALIDAAMGTINDRILFLKSSRNALAPIFRLPNELLSRIFSEYALELKALFILHWTRVMLVCRWWYFVSIHLQPLWSDIRVLGGSSGRDMWRMESQLCRSGIAPLTIRFTLDPTMEGMSNVLEHSARIRYLKVLGYSKTQHVLAFAEDLPRYNFRILQSLSLNPSLGSNNDVVDPRPVFPEEMFLDGLLPQLRKLSLCDFEVPLKSLRGLESLCLERCVDSDTSVAPSFAALLSTLESSPCLKKLKLELLLFDDADPAAPDHRPVALPALELLSLVEPVARCTTLLTHLVFPASTRLKLHPLGVSTGADIAPLLIPLRAHFRHPHALPTPLLHIHSDALSNPNAASVAYCGITLWTQPAMSYGDDAPKPPLRLNAHPASEHALMEIMALVLDALPHERITHLDTTLGRFFREASWAALVRLLPKLEMVYIQTKLTEVEVLRALQSESGDGDGSARLITLRSLHVQGARSGSDEVLPVLDALEALLEYWHGRGTPLARLEVRDCPVRYGGVFKAVPEEQWEGVARLVETFELFGEEYDSVKRRARPKVPPYRPMAFVWDG